MGLGHKSIPQVLDFSEAAEVRLLLRFHHDPSHNDEHLERLFEEAASSPLPFRLLRGVEGATFDIS